jgi:hypothetical protein
MSHGVWVWHLGAASQPSWRCPKARATANPRLSGFRIWPVEGFDQFRIYDLVQPDELIIVRILHDKRDTDTRLAARDVEKPNQH